MFTLVNIIVMYMYIQNILNINYILSMPRVSPGGLWTRVGARSHPCWNKNRHIGGGGHFSPFSPCVGLFASFFSFW